MNREKIAEAVNLAQAEIAGERGAERAINAARRALERIRAKSGASIETALAALERGAAELAEAVAVLRSAAAEADLDPARLAQAEERLFGLRELARKHRVEVDGLVPLKEEFAARLAALDDQSGLLARRAEEERAARAAYLTCAEAMSIARAEAAKRLDKAINAELKALKLDKAKFRTELSRLDEHSWGEEGHDSVAFQIATNPGAPFAPLARIASGGELARLMPHSQRSCALSIRQNWRECGRHLRPRGCPLRTYSRLPRPFTRSKKMARHSAMAVWKRMGEPRFCGP